MHTAEVPVAPSLDSGLSFRSLLSLGGGTGNAPLISLRPSLITEYQLVSTLNDVAPNCAPRFARLGLGMANGQPRALGYGCWFRCAAFCLQRRTGFEETPFRPMIADHGHLSERCFGRSHRSGQLATAEHASVHWRSLYVNDPEANEVEWVYLDLCGPENAG